MKRGLDLRKLGEARKVRRARRHREKQVPPGCRMRLVSLIEIVRAKIKNRKSSYLIVRKSFCARPVYRTPDPAQASLTSKHPAAE